LIDAEQREKDCMDVIDESEEHSAEDRENVRLATENLEALRLKLEPAHAELLQFKEAAETVNQRILRKANYNPAAAKEVVRLFPANRYVPIIDASVEETELRDIFRFLTLLMQGAEKGGFLESVSNDEMDADGLEGVNEEERTTGRSRQNRRLGIVKRDEYSRLKGIRTLRRFAEKVALPVHEFGDSVRHGFRVDPPPTDSQSCEQEAVLHADHKLLRSEQMVIKGVTVLIATELSLEPSVRREARRFLKDESTVSSRPTDKGLTVITPFSEYFGIHLLDRKPLREFYIGSDRTLFLRLVEAEKNGLIVLSIDPPQKIGDGGGMVPDLSKLFMTFMPLFLPSTQGDPNRQTWDAVRLHILQVCLEKYLLPSLQIEFRRDLLRIGRETIVEEAAATFERMLQVGPHRVPNPDSREYVKDLLRSCPGRPNYSTVAAIFQSSSGNDPLFMAFVNKDGVLRSHDLLPTQATSQKMDRIKQFIVANRPDLIVLNASGGFASRTLSMHIEKNILREVGELLETQHKQHIEQRETNGYAPRDEEEDEFVPYKAQVMVLKDDLANIFKGSTRAKAMFPELQPGGAAAVSLARFAQEPLAEYCGIWTSANATEQFGFEALFLNLHPLKALLRGAQGSLLRALETKLVDAVCDVGVDINKAVTFDHLSPMLAFVSGLGLRKADALRQNIRRSMGVVESRNSLLVKKLLGRIVWMNSAGFLRVCDIGQDKQIDPLDNTRIHPECYVTFDFAPKICADALEVDNNPGDYLDIVERLMKSVRRELEKRMKRHPKWVDLWEHGQRPVQGVTPFFDKIKTSDGTEHPLTIELHDSLSQLLLDDYAVDLENQGRGRRRLQLDHIKDELRFPWLDLRQSVQQISAEESFAILTGESDTSLYVGLKLGCTVVEISDSSFFDERTSQHKRRQRAVVKTDSGLRGFISLYDVSDEHIDVESANLSDFVHSGMRILAVVIGIKKDKLFVDLSIKPSLLNSSEAWWMEHRESDRHAKDWWENTVHRDPMTLFDRHFLVKEALDKFTVAEASQIRSVEAVNSQLNTVHLSGSSVRSLVSSATAGTNRMLMRTVHHPLFANLDYKDTEDKLRREGKGAGEVLIRPSSKGADYLTITWAFQENWFKHISVQEKGKRQGDLGLGSQLVVMESDMADEPFSDLDEIFSRYIEPMNDLVAVMVSHRNFQSGSVEDVEARMQEQLLELPNRIPYFIRFEPTRPGAFVLTWLSLNSRSEVPVKKELIEVRPYVSC
jgi:transcription elongation factor SPT6